MSSNMHDLEDAPARARDGIGRGLTIAWVAVLAAFGASLCCVGPLLFVTFGVGAGVASTFEPLRPLFTGVTVLTLAAGFYTVYGGARVVRKGDGHHAAGEACRIARKRSRDRAILWSGTVLALAFWSFTYWSTLLT